MTPFHTDEHATLYLGDCVAVIGLVSVDHASMGCAVGYHETHDYAQALHDALASKEQSDE